VGSWVFPSLLPHLSLASWKSLFLYFYCTQFVTSGLALARNSMAHSCSEAQKIFHLFLFQGNKFSSLNFLHVLCRDGGLFRFLLPLSPAPPGICVVEVLNFDLTNPDHGAMTHE
ncbi:Unknown protein, partial [Striga hermonthica]